MDVQHAAEGQYLGPYRREADVTGFDAQREALRFYAHAVVGDAQCGAPVRPPQGEPQVVGLACLIAFVENSRAAL